MATLYRDTDGASIEVAILDSSIDHPAEVATHPVEAGVPITDHRQRLPRQYTIGAAVSASLGPDGVRDYLAWVEESQGAGLRLVLDDGRDTGELVLGSWAETRQAGAIRLAMTLTERIVVSSVFAAVAVIAPAPRADVAAGFASTEDDGAQTTEEAPTSVAESALRWLGL